MKKTSSVRFASANDLAQEAERHATVIWLPQAIWSAMLAHARREAPLEACGLIAADREGRPSRFYATENELKSPTRYSIPPAEIFRILREIEAQSELLYAIFHSHPATEAYPSPTDVRLAYYPDVYYLILSLQDPEKPVLRAFTIRDGRVDEVPVVIDDA